MGVNERILAAVEAKKPVQIIYDRGSQPGTIRTVTPLAVADGTLRARCHATGAAKSFKLEYLRLADDGTVAAGYSDNPPQAQSSFRNLADVYQFYKDTLEGMGWIVKFEDYAEDSSISLFRRFKNGKPLKAPDVQFYFREWSSNIFLDEWLNEVSDRDHRSSKPYGVRVRRGSSASAFAKLDNAVLRFLSFAEDQKPGASQ